MKKKKTHGQSKHTARKPEPSVSPRKRNKLSPKWILLVIVVLVSAGIGWRYFLSSRKQTLPSTEPGQNYNLLFVSIDTLRADYLKLYNPNGADTPHLQNLAGEGVLFQNAISQIPYTLPSHSTMFTGLYPIAHGMKDNVEDVLPKDIP